MDRLPVFDEIGLQNPIYTYLTTAKMTYPMHGHPDAMFVHPPTHYWVIAELMKHLQLDLFDASAAPIFLFTVVAILTLFTGRFEFPVATAVLLALFTAVYVWSEFYTVRPDLHVTLAWLSGLLLLQSAKNHDWSHPRMFLGSLISTFAATLHYWGVLSFLAVGVYAIWFLATTSRERWQRGLEIMFAGGVLVGGLYLLEFVIPQYDNIRSITAGVQGNGGWQDAYERHRTSYAAFAMRLTNSRWPHLVDSGSAGFTARWLTDTLLHPLFENRLPAIFVAAPLLFLWRQTRPLAVAGTILPAFVLFYSQGKQVGYTGYFTPEIFLYLAGVFALIFGILSLVRNSLSSARGFAFVSAAVIALIAIAALREVPTSMGYTWQFRSNIDVLEVNRAAGSEIVGPSSVVALTSAGNWYTAGGAVVWNIFNELYLLRQGGGDLRGLTMPADALVSQVGNWWNNQASAAPLNRWYADGRLNLRGFILNEPAFSSMDQLYLVPDHPTTVPGGFLVGHESLDQFVPSESGEFLVAFLVCGNKPAKAFPSLRAFALFPVDTEPGKPGQQMAILAGKREDVATALSQLNSDCSARDMVQGDLNPLNREQFIRTFHSTNRPIRFVSNRGAAVAAKTAAPLQ